MTDTVETDAARTKPKRLLSPKKREKFAARARQLRKTRARRIVTKLVVCVGLPTLVAAIYFAFLASDIYQSTAVIMVQSVGGGHGDGAKATLSNISGSGSAKDAIAIKRYILSRDMLALLEERHQVAAHYSQAQADWWSRLAAGASFEEAYEYYLKQVEVEYDSNSSVLTLTAKAYSAEMAKTIASTILTLSEEKVNALSSRARDDQIEFAKREVKQAEHRLAEAQRAILKLQGEQAGLDSGQPADSLLLARTKVEVGLESAVLEKTIAEREYEAAMSSLTAAKMEASRQSRYLATISAPSSPDAATQPKRILGVVTVCLAALAAFGILSLLIAAVREHARV